VLLIDDWLVELGTYILLIVPFPLGAGQRSCDTFLREARASRRMIMPLSSICHRLISDFVSKPVEKNGNPS